MTTDQQQNRLYLALPERPPAGFESVLESVIVECRPACVLLPKEAATGSLPSVRELTAAHGTALLVANDVERALRIGADGVHIPPDAALYTPAREQLGQRAIIGFGCIENRHDAMVLAELGADYVGFCAAPGGGEAASEGLAETVAWWSEIFVVPCVAFGATTAESALRLTELGADFVAPAESLWLDEDAASRIGAIAAALEQTRRRN